LQVSRNPVVNRIISDASDYTSVRHLVKEVVKIRVTRSLHLAVCHEQPAFRDAKIRS
jgi:hypothetical protein